MDMWCPDGARVGSRIVTRRAVFHTPFRRGKLRPNFPGDLRSPLGGLGAEILRTEVPADFPVVPAGRPVAFLPSLTTGRPVTVPPIAAELSQQFWSVRLLRT